LFLLLNECVEGDVYGVGVEDVEITEVAKKAGITEVAEMAEMTEGVQGIWTCRVWVKLQFNDMLVEELRMGEWVRAVQFNDVQVAESERGHLWVE
jgi:hypothetical protein